jgi:chromate transporter
LNEGNYTDIVALCQFLPGPAPSQVGIAIGMSRSGWRGALAAWTAFTLPTALALYLFARGVAAVGGIQLADGFMA